MPLPAAPRKRADQQLSKTIQSIQSDTPSRSVGASEEVDMPTGPSVASDIAQSARYPSARSQDSHSCAATVQETAEVKEFKKVAVKEPARARGRSTKKTRLFVLDTNVLLHDPGCLFNFAEHDVYLPIIVLEELDAQKKGMTDVSRNARQVSRSLDQLVNAPSAPVSVQAGIPLSLTGQKMAKGRLYFQTNELTKDSGTALASLPVGKADNQILSVVHALRSAHPQRSVVLVSNDINMRIKARALGLVAEDYANDKALDDADLLYAGHMELPPDFWSTHGKDIQSWSEQGHTLYRIKGPLASALHVNQFVHLPQASGCPLMARVMAVQGESAVLRTIKDYSSAKAAVYGVLARNREQNFAMNLLMDPTIDFVSLAGTAGSGKTLMALAAGLHQVHDEKRYCEIIMTRATVSMGDEIGFLPGNEEEKMGPWMGALDDNLEFIASKGGHGEWGHAKQIEALRSCVKIKSMSFMRGRTFMDRYVIIDEAQNLTPKQMKTLVTRAGPGTKIVCMGNLAQIDTPYLTEASSGLTFVVDRFKNWSHGGHITLQRGERSRLADFAADVLGG